MPSPRNPSGSSFFSRVFLNVFALLFVCDVFVCRKHVLDQSLEDLLDNNWVNMRKTSAKSVGMNLQEDSVDLKQLLQTAESLRPQYYT